MIEEFLAKKGLKYGVITSESFDSDEVAKSLSSSPRRFMYQDVEMVVLSLEETKISDLVAYIKDLGKDVEFELSLGNGKVTLLDHKQILDLLNPQEVTNNEPEQSNSTVDLGAEATQVYPDGCPTDSVCV